jgi:CIC family chloride channel protein
MFRSELYDESRVVDILQRGSIEVQMGDSMESVAQKFQREDYYNIVVLEGGKYVGFLSRANVFSEYRNVLEYMSDE